MNDFDINKLTQAINVRKSCRAYMINKVDKNILDQINSDFYAIELPFEHDIEILDYEAMPTKSLYTSFTSPPNGVAFVGETDFVTQSKIGFLGELYILVATSYGLGTCWIGHYKNLELSMLLQAKSQANLCDMTQSFGFSNGNTSKVVTCITPLGQPSKNTMLSKMFGIIGSSRKPLIDLMAVDSPRKIFSQEITDILELARRAPSAMNCQCWRFFVTQDEKNIKVSTEIGASHLKWSHLNIDIGICACHVWLGLLHYGYSFDVKIYEEFGRTVWEFEIDKFGKNYKTECEYNFSK